MNECDYIVSNLSRTDYTLKGKNRGKNSEKPAFTSKPVFLSVDSAAAVLSARRSVCPLFFYSNRGVLKYLSPVSGRMVTTVFPFLSFLAIEMAAVTLVPPEIPHSSPSFLARSLAV